MDAANIVSITLFSSWKPPHEFTAKELDRIKRGEGASWLHDELKRNREMMTQFVWAPPLASQLLGGRYSLGADYSQRRRSGAIAIAVSIPEHLFTSPAFRTLPVLERYLLIEILAVAKRVGNDEPLGCSVRMAADMCGVSMRHGARAISALEAKGFLARIRRGVVRQGKGLSSTWRITCLPFQGEWATCDYERIYDREHNRKVADDRNGGKFLTPELESLWVKTEASFAGRSHSSEDAEIDELLATMDAEAASVSCHGRHETGEAFVPRAALEYYMKTGKFRQ